VTDAERDLLARYVEANLRGDVEALVGLLAADARQTMPPVPFWMLGRESIAAISRLCVEQNAGADWRTILVDANRQPGAAFYLRRPGEDVFTFAALNVFTIRDGEIAAIDAFASPDLVRAFDLPETLTP
jgi:RNA polymerase sigma-70 factor (ECF subfamily)